MSEVMEVVEAIRTSDIQSLTQKLTENPDLATARATTSRRSMRCSTAAPTSMHRVGSLATAHRLPMPWHLVSRRQHADSWNAEPGQHSGKPRRSG